MTDISKEVHVIRIILINMCNYVSINSTSNIDMFFCEKLNNNALKMGQVDV